jgi:hypothetical protein
MKPVNCQVRHQVYFQNSRLHDQVLDLVRGQVYFQVEKQVLDQVWGQVGRNVVTKARSKP